MLSIFQSKTVILLASALTLAACGGGSGGSGDTGGTGSVNVAGIVSFEFALPNGNCRGLNLNDPETRPIRGSPVQLFDSSDNLLAQTTSGSDGSYSFSNIDSNINVRIRVRAELQSASPAVWNVEVRDNVDTSPSPPPLTQRPLYVVEFAQFNTGTSNISDADFTALTGWGGTTYTGPRAAAPFAILDAILDAMEMVAAVDPTAVFPDLDVYWSVNNTLTDPPDVDAGELSTTYYFNNGLYMLGDANVDTDEFDDHLTLHEWGHYFEENFSRSDSWGGRHTIGESLDPRLAFGEGFATALAAIALQNPLYCDTSAPMLTGRFLDLDTENENRGNQGYFNEMSVATLIYDLWDTAPDGTDNNSIGFRPIYDTMIGPQANTAAFTSLFSFATELQSMLTGVELTFFNSQLTREKVDLGNLNIYGDGQTTVPVDALDVIPVYTDLPVDGTSVNICTNSVFDSGRDGNKFAEYRYLRMEVTQQRPYQIIVDTVGFNDGDPPSQPPAGFDCDALFAVDPDDPAIHTYSDPDFGIFLNGVQVWGGYSCTPNREETLTNTLVPGMYTLDLSEYRFADEDTIVPVLPDIFPERMCYEVSATPN